MRLFFFMNPRVLASTSFVIIFLDLAMMMIALKRCPAFFSQPSARFLVLQPVLLFVAYAVAAFLIAKRRATDWMRITKIATTFGIAGGIVEAINIATENGIPVAIHIPALSLIFMIALFISWGAAGFLSARNLNSIQAGISTAISAAAICMLIAVTSGFIIQFFGVTPDPSAISTWAEFKRSAWTDPKAFWFAETLDAAFTHLLIAPIIALVMGAIGSFAAHFIHDNQRLLTQ